MHSPFEENKRAPSRPIPSLGSNKGSAAQKSKRTESDYMPVSRNTAPTEPAPESNEAENGSVRIDNAAWINSEDIVLNEDDGAEIETSISVSKATEYKRVFVQPYSKFGDSPARTAGKKVEVFLTENKGTGNVRLALNEDLPNDYAESNQVADYWFSAEHWDGEAIVESEKIQLPFPRAEVCVGEVKEVHFLINSALPQIGVGGDLFGCLVYYMDFAQNNSELCLVISGHTDASGEAKFNYDLSADRAQMLKNILDADAESWSEILKNRGFVQDYQQMLHDFESYFGWDCNPGAVDNKKGPNTQKALKAYQAAFNKHYQGTLTEDGLIGPNTWKSIHKVLVEEFKANWKEYRGGSLPSLKYGYEGKGLYPCGENFAKATAKKNKAKERRVELSFYDEKSLPVLKKPKFVDKISTKEFPTYNSTRAKQIPIDQKTPDGVGEICYLPETHEIVIIPEAFIYGFNLAEAELSDPISKMQEAEKQLQEGDQASQDALAKAKDNVSKTLLKVTKDKPLHQSNGGDFIEFIRLRGDKYTYVRSDKIKNHLRKYKLNTGDTKQNVLRNKNGQIEHDLIKQQFKEVTVKLKNDLWKEQVTGEITEIFGKAGENFDKKLKALNKSMVVSSANSQDQTRIWDAKAEAKFLRYHAGASLGSNMDIRKGSLGLNAGANAQLALAEGKVESSIYLKNASGWRCKFSLKTNSGQIDHYDLGSLRLKITSELVGFVGVSAQASINVNINNKENGFALNPNHAKPDSKNSAGEASGRLFAGAEGGVKVGAALEWDNPEEEKLDFKVFADTAYGLSGSAGLSAEAEFCVGYKDGKIICRAKLGATLGLGLKGSLDFQIGVNTIGEFIKVIYHQLEKNNFKFLAYIDTKAFEAISNIAMRMVWTGVTSHTQISLWMFKEMHEWWNDFSSQLRKNDFLQKESEKIAKRLIDNPDLIKFLTPEGKGRLIASLCHSSWLSREEHQEAAILEVMKTVEKKAEYAKICKNVHITYHKTSGEGDVSRAASTKVKGERIIYDLMDWGAESTFTSMVKRLK